MRWAGHVEYMREMRNTEKRIDHVEDLAVDGIKYKN
jgi:hypothetical protein